MKKEIYIKKWVLTSIIIISIITIIGASSFVVQSYFSLVNSDYNSYVLRDMISSNLPVASSVDKKMIKPFDNENVLIVTDYYNIEGNKEEQEKSLILYDNTYMPNTGILYGADESFEVLSIYEGVVTNVSEDDVFGVIVEVEYANNFLCKYSSLEASKVEKGDSVAIGDVIGTSGKNKVVSTSKNMLLFELIYNGVNVDPKEYYDKNLDEMR